MLKIIKAFLKITIIKHFSREKLLYSIEVFFRSGQFRTAQRWWFLLSEIELVSNPLENEQLPWQKWWKATQYYDNKSEIWYHFFGSTHWNQNHHIYLRFSTKFSLLHHVPKSLSIASLGTQELKYMTFPNSSSSSFSHLPRHCSHPSYQKKKKKKRGS